MKLTHTSDPFGNYINAASRPFARFSITEDEAGEEAASIAVYAARHNLARTTPIVRPVPQTPVPQSLKQSQVYLAFAAEGAPPAQLDAMIEAAIVAGIPETARNANGVLFREEARIRWASGDDVQRGNPLLAGVAAHLGYDTPPKLDAFFIAAATL